MLIKSTDLKINNKFERDLCIQNIFKNYLFLYIHLVKEFILDNVTVYIVSISVKGWIV